MFYCGIDIAKYRHEATVIDQAGAAVQESISFANSKEGCEKLLALFQRLDISKEGLLIGMEATGHYWLSVYGYLLEQGFEVKVINPIQSEAFRKMYIRQTKNDRKDSFIIAQIMRFGQFFVTNLSLVFRHLWRCLPKNTLPISHAGGVVVRFHPHTL